MSAHSDAVNAYRLLGVHPSAPNDLLNAAYWRTASELQKRRATDESADATLYAITRSYELVANPQARAAYDASVGLSVTSVMVRPLSKIRRSLLTRLLRRAIADSSFDCYEMIGLDAAAPDNLLPEAYKIMRDYYLRAPDARRRAYLISLLDESYARLSDREERRRYDAGLRNRTPSNKSAPTPAKHERESASKAGLAERSGEAVAKARHTTEPAADTMATATERRVRTIRPAQAITAMSHATGSAWKMAKRFWNWETRLRLPRVAFRRKSTPPKDVNPEQRVKAVVPPKIAPRRVPYKSADAEEEFLGRLASRVQSDSHEGDQDSGDQAPGPNLQ